MKKQAGTMALIFIGITIIFTVIGQISVKWGMLQLGASPSDPAELPGFLLHVFTNPGFIAGMASSVVAAIAWSLALSRSNLSFAYPFMSSSIVLVLILSAVMFGETISITRWLGVVVVVVGIFLASR